MARWQNTRERYGIVAMTLHWLIAAAIVFMLALGLYMEDLPLSHPDKFALYQLHKSIGITILLLTAVRLIWRLANPVPPLPAGMARWERIAARTTHIGFYALLFAIPLSGWAMVSVSPFNIPTVLYGVLPWPHLPIFEQSADKEAIEATFKEIHEILAFLAIATLALHVAGALKHHFVARDDTLRRMLPRFLTAR